MAGCNIWNKIKAQKVHILTDYAVHIPYFGGIGHVNVSNYDNCDVTYILALT